MDFGDTIRAISIAIQVGVPVLLEGSVGEAKTSIVESLFQRLCVDHQTSICALHEPPEYGGYPVPGDGAVSMLPVGWVKRLAGVPERDEKGRRNRTGLFLDELSNGAPATRSAAMRGILDNTWGEATIPTLTTVAAMNPPELAESGYELSAPLATRFLHIQWDMPEDYWLDAMIADFPAPKIETVPQDWEKHLDWAKTLVAAFGKARPGALKTMPAARVDRAKPFGTYRTWTFALRVLAACRACGKDLEHDITVTLLGGCVGPQGAAEFIAYASTLDLPDPEAVLKDPDKLRLPDRGDRAFAVLTAVVLAVLRKNELPRWNAAWKVMAQAEKQGRIDLAAGAAKALAEHRPVRAPLPKEINVFIPMLKAAGLMTA